MALAPGSSSWIEYQGDRSASAITQWATSLITSKVVTLRNEAALKTFLAQCGGPTPGKKSSASKAAAAWSVCLVLVSDKQQVPNLWKSLSVAYEGKVAFGFVPADNQAVLAALGAAAEHKGKDSSSRVVAICNGDLRTSEAYKGDIISL
jgi:protein disulfide-isomerase A6